MAYDESAALKAESDMMNALRAADRRIAELEAKLSQWIYWYHALDHYDGPFPPPLADATLSESDSNG
jgi:hypothetical protein